MPRSLPAAGVRRIGTATSDRAALQGSLTLGNRTDPFLVIKPRCLSSGWKELPRPTGMFVVCGRLAANLCELALKLGRIVPNDLAIIATGNDLAAALVSRPSLSTVGNTTREIGFQAAAEVSRLSGRLPGRQIVLSPGHVVRVVPPRRGRWTTCKSGKCSSSFIRMRIDHWHAGHSQRRTCIATISRAEISQPAPAHRCRGDTPSTFAIGTATLARK